MDFKKVFKNNRNEWHSDNYQIVERIYKDLSGSSDYHCFKKTRFGFNFMEKQPRFVTPECAKEFCEIDSGEL